MFKMKTDKRRCSTVHFSLFIQFFFFIFNDIQRHIPVIYHVLNCYLNQVQIHRFLTMKVHSLLPLLKQMKNVPFGLNIDDVVNSSFFFRSRSSINISLSDVFYPRHDKRFERNDMLIWWIKNNKTKKTIYLINVVPFVSTRVSSQTRKRQTEKNETKIIKYTHFEQQLNIKANIGNVYLYIELVYFFFSLY